VLVVSNLFPRPHDPNYGIFVAQMLRRLEKRCEVEVICPLPWFPRLPFLRRLKRWYYFAEVPAEYEWKGIRVHSPKYLMIPGFSGLSQAAGMRPVLRRTIRRLHGRRPFDLVHTHWLHPDGVASAAALRGMDLPLVLSGRGCDVNRFLSDARKGPQIRSALAQADAVTVVSEAMRETLVSAGVPPERIHTIYNGVDREIFFPGSREEARSKLDLEKEGGEKTILFVGSLLAVKGVQYLLEAAALLAGRRRDFRLLLVGDGDERPRYEEFCGQLGLTEQVRFAGTRPHGEIADWMRASDLFCLPSIREGLPNVILEAQACGRPVVASRVGGIPEVVDESNGILFPPQDAAALADALARGLDGDWDEAGIAASRESFSWEACAQRYHELLRAVASA